MEESKKSEPATAVVNEGEETAVASDEKPHKKQEGPVYR